MKIVHEWLKEMVPGIPDDVETVAREISLRGFEVAAVENGVIDFEITANRPDCLSHLGLAREAAVIWHLPPVAQAFRPAPSSVAQAFRPAPSSVAQAFRPAPLSAAQPSRPAPSPSSAAQAFRPAPVAIDAPDLCPRYAAQLFDVKVGPSPAWLTARLEAAGVRPINNVVDVTNYVMLEIGQPMHAFDLEKLGEQRIVVRRARPDETLRTLDGMERRLDGEMLVIADGERPVAIGGVMGGQDSEISGSTRRMLLESAYFHPPSVRRTSKRLGLKTEASTRFERGADIENPVAGLARAAELLEQIGAAQAGAVWDVYPGPREPLQLTLRTSRIQRVLGVAVPAEDVPRLLTPLGFSVTAQGDGTWTIGVPSFRVDVTREIDLIEEVGRHYGFDRIPATFPTLAAPQRAPDVRMERERRVRSALAAAGLSESMTFAFIERQAAAPFCDEAMEPATIANPLSEKFAVLRPSLLPGLIDSASHNRRRGRKDVRLFESGSRFGPAGEGRAVGLVWSGAGNMPSWSAPPRGVDFFDVKGAVELLAAAVDVADLEFSPSTAAFLVRGRAADVTSGGAPLGCLGQLQPAIAEARGFPPGEEVYVAEIDLDALVTRMPGGDLRAQTLPRFPSIVRDLSILVDEALPAASVRGTIRSAAPEILHTLVEFDRYQGKGIPEGRVSLSLRLTFRSPERTLTDDEVDAAMAAIVDALRQVHGAERR